MAQSTVEFRKAEKTQLKPRKKIRKKGKRVIKHVVALRKVKKSALRAREKRAIKTRRAISPRHKADLVKPDEPFAILQMKGDMFSTAIRKFDYDPVTLTLKVQFWKVRVKKKRVVSRRPGGIYLYFVVPPKVHEDLIRASSKGRYFYYNIRGLYNFTRLG